MIKKNQKRTWFRLAMVPHEGKENNERSRGGSPNPIPTAIPED
jgi:hypothetical protein